MIQKIKKLYRAIKKHFPSIKEGFKETLPLYKAAIQNFFLQIAIMLFRVFNPEIYKSYTWIFQWTSLIGLFYLAAKLYIHTYYLYTKEWRKLDSLLQEYEGDSSNFDFSFPNEFIKGIYQGEGVRGKNVDFIKRLDLGVSKLDPSQRKIALIHIKNYNDNTFNFFSGYNIFGILTVLATIATIFNFETLKSNIVVFVVIALYGIMIGIYIYRVNKKKLYICKVLEDVLSYSIKP